MYLPTIDIIVSMVSRVMHTTIGIRVYQFRFNNWYQSISISSQQGGCDVFILLSFSFIFLFFNCVIENAFLTMPNDSLESYYFVYLHILFFFSSTIETCMHDQNNYCSQPNSIAVFFIVLCRTTKG